MLSKYTLKRINYKMFGKNFSETYNQPHNKRVPIIKIFYPNMLIFRDMFYTHSDQNIYQNALNYTIFSKFSRVAYAPNYFYMKKKQHYIFKILSKYTLKHINRNMFSKISL